MTGKTLAAIEPELPFTEQQTTDIANCLLSIGWKCDGDAQWTRLMHSANTLRAAIAAHVAKAPAAGEVAGLVDSIIRDLSELPDYTSPDEWPDALLATPDELRVVLERHLASLASTPVGEVAGHHPVSAEKAVEVDALIGLRELPPIRLTIQEVEALNERAAGRGIIVQAHVRELLRESLAASPAPAGGQVAQGAVARERCDECSTPAHCKSFAYENCAYPKVGQPPAPASPAEPSEAFGRWYARRIVEDSDPPCAGDALEGWNAALATATTADPVATPSAPAVQADAAQGWEGAEEWMPLAWELCAEENGEESCNELVWEGGPIPEPWGDRWLKYEDEAKALIALVRKCVAMADPSATAQALQAGQADALADLWEQSAADVAAAASWNEYQKGLAEGLRQAARDLRATQQPTPQQEADIAASPAGEEGVGS